tara:strand:+ start:1425 stop:1577 length:153 start_codon:yes stop_codon:yes gene_type:complete
MFPANRGATPPTLNKDAGKIGEIKTSKMESKNVFIKNKDESESFWIKRKL